jgi:type IV pilus assembly protein PilX
MPDNDTKVPNHQNRQRGTVLIVALLLLLVMTILGLTAMNSSVLQGLMATSYQTQTATLAQTENLLSELEEFILQGAAGTDYNVDFCPGVTRPAVGDRAWTGIPVRALNGGRYTVEYLGQRLLPGESAAVGEEDEPPKFEYFLRPTVRLQGDRDSLRIVQSVVKIGANPDVCP